MLATVTTANPTVTGNDGVSLGLSGHLLTDDAHPTTRCLVDYWDRLRGRRRMPSFSDVDPVDIPWALASIFVIRSLDDGSRFEYRLSGEEINRRYGKNLAGKSAADLFRGQAADVVAARWRRVAGQPAACRVLSRHHTVDDRWALGDRILLPLSSNGVTADHILGHVIYHDGDKKDRHRPFEGSETVSATWVGV